MPFASVSPPLWNNGQTVYLLGGGPSLTGFDLERLRNCTVVAVNNGVLHVPWAAAVVSVDTQWQDNRYHQLQGFAGEIVFGIHPDENPEAYPRAKVLRWLNSTTLSQDPEVLHSASSSGFAALNYAYLKGAKRIVLLGYDYCQSGKHWFGKYPWASGSADDIYAIWARMYDDTLPQLQAAGVEVLNASMDSMITAFPKISWRSL